MPTDIPPGPYITAANANERVKIPDPPLPTFPARSNCPHLGTSLLDWHSSSTWGGVVPTSGDVTLPRNTKVIVRRSVVGVLGTVTIPSSSELIFSEDANGITFDAGGIDVAGSTYHWIRIMPH
jgi:hypothetical protein